MFSKKYEQLPLFDIEKYSRNYQAVNAKKIRDVNVDFLNGLFLRELKPILKKFNLPVWGNSLQMVNRIKSLKRKDNEKRMGF